MKKTRIHSIQRLLWSCLMLWQSALAGEPAPSQWKSLFNGKDLSGWVALHDVTFEVKDTNLRLVKAWVGCGRTRNFRI
jgi:hypothetical protein